MRPPQKTGEWLARLVRYGWQSFSFNEAPAKNGGMGL